MGRHKREPAARGSEKWLQVAVNDHPDLLNDDLRQLLDLGEGRSIGWVSPLGIDDLAEYSNASFLEVLGVGEHASALANFWPARGGPHWDGLARSTRGDLILVEAKSHIGELKSSPCQAGPESLSLIEKSLEETRRHLNGDTYVDWSKVYYQYANRLAHLYFLRELRKLPAWLAFVYFVGDHDMNGPASADEWSGAISMLESTLGVRNHRLARYVMDVFVDVNDLRVIHAD